MTSNIVIHTLLIQSLSCERAIINSVNIRPTTHTLSYAVVASEPTPQARRIVHQLADIAVSE
jgi:hypothetical protein